LHAAEAREKIETKALHKENTSKRAAMEVTNSSLKRSQGADKLCVRGIIKSTIVVGLKIIGNNFKRIRSYFASLNRIGAEIKNSLDPQGRDLYFAGVASAD